MSSINNPIPHRLFLALPISQELQATIARWREAYVRLPVRWVEGKNLHVTLVPPWEEDDIEKAKERLRSLQNHPLTPFPRHTRDRLLVKEGEYHGELLLNFNRVRFGPRPDKTPRLIWAVGDIPRSLMFLLERVMEVFEHPLLNRTFRLHLTLARFRPQDFRYFAKEEFGPVDWSERVEKVVLMESHLLPAGAQYEVLDQVRLVL